MYENPAEHICVWHSYRENEVIVFPCTRNEQKPTLIGKKNLTNGIIICSARILDYLAWVPKKQMVFHSSCKGVRYI